MELTDGKGADVCFDPVGGDLFDAALSSLGWGGRILLIGFVGGSRIFPPPAAREAPGGARLVASLFPLARAGQAPSVCRGAPRVVREGHAGAARHPPAAARARVPRPFGCSPTRTAHGKVVVMPERGT